MAEFMFQNVAYRAIVYRTGIGTTCLDSKSNLMAILDPIFKKKYLVFEICIACKFAHKSLILYMYALYVIKFSEYLIGFGVFSSNLLVK